MMVLRRKKDKGVKRKLKGMKWRSNISPGINCRIFILKHK
jgi:hypothetical protein